MSVRFQQRWFISGAVTTATPLHVGDGGHTARAGLTGADGGAVEIASVATDCDGRAYIPGTAIKGWLRRSLARIDAAGADGLLGSPDRGGARVSCWDARALDQSPVFAQAPPYWDPVRLTGVLGSTAIDRRLGAALEGNLAHAEYVPAGVSFSVQMLVTALDDWREGATDQDALALLLAACNLADSSSTEPEHIGAEEAQGWGIVSWSLADVTSFDQKDLKTWLAQPSANRPVGARMIVSSVDRAPLLSKAAALVDATPSPERLEARVKVEFQEMLLIEGQDTDEAIAFLRAEDGRPWLRGRSFKGALRSQAERIVRTIAGAEAAACTPGHGCDGARAFGNRQEHPFVGGQGVCVVCAVFGATGWRSPFECSHFQVVGDSVPFRQDRLAIDRFTGGGVAKDEHEERDDRRFTGRKFALEGAYRPRFVGRLSLDVERLGEVGLWNADGSAAIGLLAFALRDLAEHDVVVGMAGGTGYGVADLTLDAWTAVPSSLAGLTLPVTGGIERDSSAGAFVESSFDKLVTLVQQWPVLTEN